MKKKDQLTKQKIIKQAIHFCLVIFITLGISISLQSILAVWTDPTIAPPGGSSSMPINTSENAQNKAGYLSIGAADYNEMLTVRNDTDGIARIRIADFSQNPELQLQYGSGSNDHWAINNEQNGDKLNIWGGGDNRLTILQNGNVGVGTSTPNSLLHLYDTIKNAELDIQSVAGINNHWGIYQASDTGSLKFWQGDDRLVITKDGHVGIGSTTPTGANLVVNGTISALTPTANNHVATKGYVDARISASNKMQIFDKPGTYTWIKPTNVTMVYLTMVGGGGGGGYGGMYGSGDYGGGGGGGGGSSGLMRYPILVSDNVLVIVGEGGLGGGYATDVMGTKLPGARGNNSSFGDNVVSGGYYGFNGYSSGGGGTGSQEGGQGVDIGGGFNQPGKDGSNATENVFSSTGGAGAGGGGGGGSSKGGYGGYGGRGGGSGKNWGGVGGWYATDAGGGGGGGSSILGSGGYGGNSNNTGNIGGVGAGGGGGGSKNKNGGNGGDGKVIVEWVE
ncbi:MAG: hypothetical protein V1651_01905 [Patescibacteria group bacterium]